MRRRRIRDDVSERARKGRERHHVAATFGSFDVGTIVFKQKTMSGLPTRRRPGSPSEGLSRVLLRRVPKTFWSVVLVVMTRSRGRRIAAAHARTIFFPPKTVCPLQTCLTCRSPANLDNYLRRITAWIRRGIYRDSSASDRRALAPSRASRASRPGLVYTVVPGRVIPGRSGGFAP